VTSSGMTTVKGAKTAIEGNTMVSVSAPMVNLG
jgi:hypothetical protein